MKKYKNGVFLSRFQPVHNGHLAVIKQMIEECEDSFIIIGSSEEDGTTRNPYPLLLRSDMLSEALDDIKDSFYISWIQDIPAFYGYQDEEIEPMDTGTEWGRFLYYNIIGDISEPTTTFTMYCGEQSLWTIQHWFEKDLRERIFFRPVNTELDVSGTKVREAINNKDINYVKQNCPKSVADRFNLLYSIQNPKTPYQLYKEHEMNVEEIKEVFGLHE